MIACGLMSDDVDTESTTARSTSAATPGPDGPAVASPGPISGRDCPEHTARLLRDELQASRDRPAASSSRGAIAAGRTQAAYEGGNSGIVAPTSTWLEPRTQTRLHPGDFALDVPGDESALSWLRLIGSRRLGSSRICRGHHAPPGSLEGSECSSVVNVALPAAKKGVSAVRGSRRRRRRGSPRVR